MSKGKFIVIEGTDGVGKTIQSKLLSDKLESLGIPVYHTAEPSLGPIGKMIRHTYLSGDRQVDKRLINYLYAADRLDHITNTVDGMLSKINQGINVVCDRYYLSSMGYYPLEFYGTDQYMESMKFIMDLNQTAYEIMCPDATVILTLSEEETNRRLSHRDDKNVEIWDNSETVRRTRETYEDAIKLLHDRGENLIYVDASGDPETVSERVWNAIRSILIGDS